MILLWLFNKNGVDQQRQHHYSICDYVLQEKYTFIINKIIRTDGGGLPFELMNFIKKI